MNSAARYIHNWQAYWLGDGDANRMSEKIDMGGIVFAASLSDVGRSHYALQVDPCLGSLHAIHIIDNSNVSQLCIHSQIELIASFTTIN